jgi:16S rRNA (cytosine1402-N4)-methyltransferase
MGQDVFHVPVMSREVLEYLDPKAGGVFLDGTLGLAGHSRLMAEKVGDSGRLICLDRDESSLVKAKENLVSFHGQLNLIHSNFNEFDLVLKKLGVSQVDGMLFDLGISSFQLNNLQRGFSFKAEGPLDMRMDQTGSVSAENLVNELSEEELADIIFQYGEERYSRRIARSIIQYRKHKRLSTAAELEEIIFTSVPLAYRRQRIHPATRTFQALRIAVNKELDSLTALMEKFLDYLKIGGRIAVISFHSLEDRIVKEKFKDLSKKNEISLLFKKPLRPCEDEININPRARSARLRVAERIACN